MLPQKGSHGSEVVQGMVVGSIPTAPTSFFSDSTGLAKSVRQQKAALRREVRRRYGRNLLSVLTI
jgi:hypothetical protein